MPGETTSMESKVNTILELLKTLTVKELIELLKAVDETFSFVKLVQKPLEIVISSDTKKAETTNE